MNKRFLMRLGKNPFEPVSGYGTLDRNTIGGNNGNLIFGAAAHKLFSTEGVTVEANNYQVDKSMADRINSEYDAFILPLANAFRPSFEPELLRTAELIEKLKIPVLMLSGGAQIGESGDSSHLLAMEGTTKRFLRAVLEKSSHITVRGEDSAEYISSLGFKDVLVVGCPSMTMFGRGHSVTPKKDLPPGGQIAYNLEPTNLFGLGLIEDAEAEFDPVYMPQDRSTLEMLLWGTSPYPRISNRYPFNPNHHQIVDQVAEYHLDAWTWIDRMRRFDFSFGARIHGNIAAVLGGTPSVVLAHDRRTMELAKYHRIPYIDVYRDGLPSSVEELYSYSNFDEFNAGHAERFDILSDFIHENGFDHIYDEGEEDALNQYESKLANIDYPESQRFVWSRLTDREKTALQTIQSRYLSTANRLKTLERKQIQSDRRSKKIEAKVDRLLETLRGL